MTFTNTVEDGQGHVISQTTGPTPPEFDNRDAITSKVQAALAANSTFLAIASPTTAQTLAQVKLLTRECSAIIRLFLNLLDSQAGT